MARRLGEAFVSIEADASLFRASAIAGMKKALAGVTGSIKIKPDMDERQFDQSLAALKLRMEALSQTLAKMRASVDTKSAEASIVKLQTQLHSLAKNVSSITFSADTSRLDAAIAAERANLARYQKQASSLRVDADATKIDAKLAALAKETASLNKRLGSMTADVDIDKALTRLYAIDAEIALINSMASRIEFVANTNKFNAAIAASAAKIKALQNEKIEILGNVDVGSLLSAEAGMLGLEAATAKMADTTDRASKATGNFRGLWTGGWLNGAIAGIGIWHIVLDGLLEALIIVTASAAALAAGIVAMGESALDLTFHLKGVQTASSALGVDIPPLTGKLDDLMTAMAPRTIEAFGGGLQLISSQAGNILDRMEPVVNLFDTWIAKIDIWAAHERDFGTIIQAGREFLEQLGKAVAILADAITNLLQKDPGIAHFLLDFVQGALLLLDAFSKLPAPIVEATLAIHGAYLWLKLLVAVPLLSFAKSLGILSAAQTEAATSALKFQNIVKFLLFNPFGWALDAAVGIGILAYQLTQATGKAKSFIATLEGGLADASASTAINQISLDIGKLRDQIDEVPARVGNLELSVTDFAAKAGNSFNQVSYDLNKGDISGSLVDIGKTAYNAVRAFFGWSSIGPQIIQTKNDVDAFKGEIVKLSGEQDRLFKTTGRLVTGQNQLHVGTLSVSQAFALMDLAGVKVGDSFDVQWQKVKNLVTGYQTLSIRGGILKNSVDAITFASLQQQERVAQLNQAWDTFFKTVSGGETGFLSFAQQTIGLFASMSKQNISLRDSNGKVSTSIKALATSGDQATISMTGLNVASINARQTFLQSASAANDQVDNLTTLANAAGLGADGTAMLTRATQDMVASLLPATGGSKALTDVLYVLAQRGGYQGANSFKELSKWVSKVKDPMTDLDKITTTLTTDASNLTDDVKNLSLALGQTLNDAMAAAILQATGGQAAFDDFATAMLHTKANSQAQQDAALKLGNQLLGLTGNTKDAHNEFDAFAQQMGISRKAADQLWSEIANKLTPGIEHMSIKAIPGAKNAFVDWSKNGLDLSKGASDRLWTQITTKLGPQLDKLGDLTVPKAKNKFIDWAENSLKLTQNQAKDLWGELVTLQQHIDDLHGKTVQIHMNGQGLYTITGSIIAASQGKGGSGNAAGGLAAGGFISGGMAGQDSVPAMLMPGELVVPTKMVDAGAVDHLRGMLPGFSGGGMVARHFAAGGVVRGRTDNLSGTFVDGMYTQFQSTMTNEMVGVMRTSISAAKAAAVAAAQAAAKAAAFSVSGGGPVGGDQAVNKALARSMFPWPASMWASYDYLEMREAGYNRFARNPSSGAYGIPQALPPSKMPFAAQAAGGSHAGPQLSWMYSYIRSVYGNPVNAAQHERNVSWYGSGGMVPGYASGGTVSPALITKEGKSYLKAWQTRHGGGFGAAWGPIAVNPQIDSMKASINRATVLSHAPGLSAGKHRFWANAAADENKRLKTLIHELGVERSYRSQLGGSDTALQSAIKAAGTLPALKKNVTAWKSQINSQKGTITAISKMLGLSAAQVAAAEKAGTLGPGGAALPKITHTFGGDVGDTIGAYLASVIAPLGMAGGGMAKSYDKGGWLQPGYTMAYNGTGRPEAVGSPGAVQVTLQVDAGSSGADQFLAAMIKKYVKVNGSGNVQKAYGAH